MTNVLEYLENAASNTPQKVAFADLEEQVTYAQLAENARRIGTALAKKAGMQGSACISPVREVKPVPVYMRKSVKAVTVFMGAVYAGCFYSMLDAKQPAARLESILGTLDASFVVTDREHEQQAKEQLHVQCLIYEDLLETEPDQELLRIIRERHIDTDPLYVNFTSGSTGTPKGVAVCHRSVIDFIDYFTELFGITGEDVIGNQAPFDFDVSVKDIYSTLRTGATMQIIPPQYFSIPTSLLDFLIERDVTTLIWAVSAVTLVSRLHGFTYRIPTKVRRVIFSGEVMPVKQLNIWREALPDAMFVNVYGPTEITCNCTWYIVDRDFDVSETLPMGKPFPNERVFLLDEEDHLVTEPGQEGEVCVAGTALALGYYRNPEATAAAFVPNPLNDRYPELIYRTGDLATYLENGDMSFTGRKDFQIKHMGHRIELGEIEQAMNAVPEITSCCCLFLKERITAFYTGEIDKKTLAGRLKEKIPDYMVPNTFIQMDQLPMNKNGKTDRKALAALRQKK